MTENTFEDLFARAESSAKGVGKYEAMLSAELQELLGEFVEWLEESDDKTTNTAQSYKSYVSKALALPEEKLTSDQRSGVRAFRRFLDQR